MQEKLCLPEAAKELERGVITGVFRHSMTTSSLQCLWALMPQSKQFIYI